MRIGLFGGSFDPIHIGHLLVAEAAMEELNLDKIVFIPAAKSPFKPDSNPLSGESRLKLVRVALAGCPRYEVDDTEVRQGGISYTIDTVRRFMERIPNAQWVYLIGADHLPHLNQWRESATLAELLTFAAVPRPGEIKPVVPDGFKVIYLSGFPLQISSSQVRRRIAEGKHCRFLLPQGVWELILDSKLYH